MKKPDFKKTASELKALSDRDRALKELINSEKSLQDTACQALKKLRLEAALKSLKEMPLRALNASKQGIRISALEAAGFSNVGELVGMKLSDIERIKGIGGSGAQAIKTTLKEIEDTVYGNTKARLSASESPGSIASISALYKIIHAEPLLKKAAELYSKYHTPIEKAAQDAQAIKNTFFWFFSSNNKKEQAVNGEKKVNALFTGSFLPEADNLIKLHRECLSVKDEAAFSDFKERPAFYYSALEALSEKISSIKEIADIREKIKSDVPEELAKEVESYELSLDGFKASLRPYQAFGARYALHQQRVLLGDEMGLGKTVQALATMQDLYNKGKRRFVVICPASVLINWVREIGSFSSLIPLLIRDDKIADNSREWSNSGGIAVVNFEGLQKFLDFLPAETKADMTVVDEAHYIKNPAAKRTKAASTVLNFSENILLMSGTPLENRIEEMKNLISMLDSGIAKKIQSTEDSWSGEGFRKKIAPVYLRRNREDVLTELPELIEKDEICPVNSAEKEAYKKDLDAGDFMGMRQVSFKNVASESSSKLKRILELCEEAGEQGRKILIFSFFKNTLLMVKSALGDRTLKTIDGSLSSAERQEILDEFTKSKPGTVLLSQIVAGGTGLNVQAASVVILCEPQIKPSLETQAIARSYRMGQLNSVLVYRMMSDDTIDEYIRNMLKEKQEIFDKFADDSEMADVAGKNWITEAVKAQQKIFSGEGPAAIPELGVSEESTTAAGTLCTGSDTNPDLGSSEKAPVV